jgi:carbonic anhydrase
VLLSSDARPNLLFESSADLGTVKEASTKLGNWWKEVTEMQTEVKKFQTEANDKAVDELVHLERVKDLLVELKKQVPVEQPPKHWTYTGEDGPEHWAELDPAFKTCGAGREQSPINFELDLKEAQLPSIGWNLQGPVEVTPSTGNTGESETAGKEFYNGHTFEVEDVGSPTIVFDGITYTLAQFHTHTPSEHKVAGRHYDMEMHFVHKAVVDGVTKLAVIGCFFEKGDRSPTFIKELMRQALPKATSTPTVLDPTLDFRSIAQEVLVGTVPSKLEAADEFVPNFKNYFTYPGSLTTPPCSEGVKWVVLKNPVSIEAADLAALEGLEGKNNRPVQPLYDRVIQDVGGKAT